MRAPRHSLVFLFTAVLGLAAWAQTSALVDAEPSRSPEPTTTIQADDVAAPPAPSSDLASGQAGSQALSEEDLLLRLLLGVAFPLFILVAMRLLRRGLRRRERHWENAMLTWIDGMEARRGKPSPSGHYRTLVQTVTGVVRIVLFGAVVSLLALTWFALFPQTRPLAREFAVGILSPILALLGAAARGILVLLYSAAVLVAAAWLTRRMKGKGTGLGASALHPDHSLTRPLQALVWIIAAVAILLPHEGLPRDLAVGIIVLTTLVLLIAGRPLMEEAARGIYISITLSLKPGMEVCIEGSTYRVKSLGAAMASLEQEGQITVMSYSHIMKSTLTIVEPGGAREEK